ncbi:hypothetical protein BCR35DRAFT_356167 [Leucosporidium creatinivorum]|uniref:LSM domain-containing protein n=1 Tax=Leucosporidium creatinivorum TaxID=106004 RepID=A0A1Y2CP63_9BASI|nr:hypothetical protein BCR35DRAFT_356167 [Leucosporidium creatinivorum]
MQRTPPNHTPSITALTATLGSTYRLSIPSGRTFLGQFLCIDPQGNLILDQTVEYEGTEGKGDGREVGMVLVPRKWWGCVEREVQAQGEEEDEEQKGLYVYFP